MEGLVGQGNSLSRQRNGPTAAGNCVRVDPRGIGEKFPSSGARKLGNKGPALGFSQGIKCFDPGLPVDFSVLDMLYKAERCTVQYKIVSFVIFN